MRAVNRTATLMVMGPNGRAGAGCGGNLRLGAPGSSTAHRQPPPDGYGRCRSGAYSTPIGSLGAHSGPRPLSPPLLVASIHPYQALSPQQSLSDNTAPSSLRQGDTLVIKATVNHF